MYSIQCVPSLPHPHVSPSSLTVSILPHFLLLTSSSPQFIGLAPSVLYACVHILYIAAAMFSDF